MREVDRAAVIRDVLEGRLRRDRAAERLRVRPALGFGRSAPRAQGRAGTADVSAGIAGIRPGREKATFLLWRKGDISTLGLHTEP